MEVETAVGGVGVAWAEVVVEVVEVVDVPAAWAAAAWAAAPGVGEAVASAAAWAGVACPAAVVFLEVEWAAVPRGEVARLVAALGAVDFPAAVRPAAESGEGCPVAGWVPPDFPPPAAVPPAPHAPRIRAAAVEFREEFPVVAAHLWGAVPKLGVGARRAPGPPGEE